jgi:EAL domain-containing protein (putative c-di-GMP-specific phosphodiesterase class I)
VSPSRTGQVYFLEGSVDAAQRTWRTPLRKLPFRIGRRPDAELVLRSPRVSHLHAELHESKGVLWLRDLDSTNGTLVNGRRLVGACPVEDGDLIVFADQEFRLIAVERVGVANGDTYISTQSFSGEALPSERLEQARQFKEMLDARAFTTRFQPIVSLTDRAVIGLELLGAGVLAGAQQPAGILFELAEALELEVELSEALRDSGLEHAATVPADRPLFLNTHPTELEDQSRFLDSLRQVRESRPEQLLVLEVHEHAVIDSRSFAELRRRLEELSVAVAFDDFGTGKARLFELIDLQPCCVKFDRAWTRGIDSATTRRRTLVAGLVQTLSRMKIVSIAEGVETEGEAAVCGDLGFDGGQGFFFAAPSELSEIDLG